MEIISHLEEKIRDVPDFPKPGILFKDITPLLNHGPTFQKVTHHFADRYRDVGLTKIVGIESRGFIFGSALAHHLGVGLTVVRKPGKLPYHTEKEEYELEYGTDCLEIHVDAVTKDDKVIIIDDLLATGGTAAAATRLVTRQGAHVHEIAFVIELAFLKGKDKLNHPSYSILQY